MIKAHYVIHASIELPDARCYDESMETWEDVARFEGRQLTVEHDAGAKVHYDVNFVILDGANASEKLRKEEP